MEVTIKKGVKGESTVDCKIVNDYFYDDELIIKANAKYSNDGFYLVFEQSEAFELFKILKTEFEGDDNNHHNFYDKNDIQSILDILQNPIQL